MEAVEDADEEGMLDGEGVSDEEGALDRVKTEAIGGEEEAVTTMPILNMFYNVEFIYINNYNNYHLFIITLYSLSRNVYA